MSRGLEMGVRLAAGRGQPRSSPSFLVNSGTNVNSALYRARNLVTMWDFLVYKGRVGRTHVLLNSRRETERMMIIPARKRSRYFDEGRWRISCRIKQRLGRYQRVPGLMSTLTYDPKRIGKREAWANFGRDTRQFLNAVNQYRSRRGWRRAHYLWVVEVQPGTGYPHVHIFFPSLRFLAPVSILSGNWSRGRANIEAPKKINVNCAGYISKYLRKMEGWSDLHLALLWSGHSRMYSFSRGFSAKLEKGEPEWRLFGVVHTDDIGRVVGTLEEGGWVVNGGAGAAEGGGNGNPGKSG